MFVQDVSCNRHSFSKSAALYNMESSIPKAKKLTLPNSLLAIYQHVAQPALATRCGICVMYVVANLNKMCVHQDMARSRLFSKRCRISAYVRLC